MGKCPLIARTYIYSYLTEQKHNKSVCVVQLDEKDDWTTGDLLSGCSTSSSLSTYPIAFICIFIKSMLMYRKYLQALMVTTQTHIPLLCVSKATGQRFWLWITIIHLIVWAIFDNIQLFAAVLLDPRICDHLGWLSVAAANLLYVWASAPDISTAHYQQETLSGSTDRRENTLQLVPAVKELQCHLVANESITTLGQTVNCGKS